MGDRVVDRLVAPVTRGLYGVEPDDVVAVTDDAAPAGERTLALWQPALRDPWVLPAPSEGGPAPADSPSPDAPQPTHATADGESLPAPNVTPSPQQVSGTEAPPRAGTDAIASTAHRRPPVTSGATPPGSAEPDSGDPGEDPSARRSASARPMGVWPSAREIASAVCFTDPASAGS